MVFPQKIAYLRYEFEWNAGQDIQVFGMFLEKTTSGGWPLNDAPGAAQAIANRGRSAFHDTMNAGFYVQAVRAVQCVAYTMDDAAEKVTSKGVAQFTGSFAFQGGGTGAMPAENSLVLSLYGYDPAGFGGPTRAQKRGRMFLPTLASGQLGSDGRVTDTVLNQQLDNWSGMFDLLRAPITDLDEDFSVNPIIRSMGGKNGGAQPFSVTHLRMGHIVDTQRRRRNALREDYISIDVRP